MNEYMIQTDKFRFTIEAAEIDFFPRSEEEPYPYILAYDLNNKIIGFFLNVVWYLEKKAYKNITECEV